MPGLAQRHEGEPKPVILANAAAWLAAALPGGAPDNRHSRRVALLKRVLPAIGVALLLLIAVWPRLAPLWERMRLAFPAIDLREARQLEIALPLSPLRRAPQHAGPVVRIGMVVPQVMLAGGVPAVGPVVVVQQLEHRHHEDADQTEADETMCGAHGS